MGVERIKTTNPSHVEACDVSPACPSSAAVLPISNSSRQCPWSHNNVFVCLSVWPDHKMTVEMTVD